MPLVFDEEGNEFDLPVPPAEVKAHLEQGQKVVTDFENYKKENEATIGQLKTKLSGLENKDFNFKKLRDMTDEQKSKLTETELALKQEIEKHEEDNNNFRASITNTWKGNALKGLVGTNEDLKKLVLNAYDEIGTSAQTEQEIAEKMRKAYIVATGQAPSATPQISGDFGGLAPKKVVDKKVSPEVKELGKQMGLSEEDFHKYSNQ